MKTNMTVRKLINILMELPLDIPIGISIRKKESKGEVIYVGRGKVKIKSPETINDERVIWIEDEIITKPYIHNREAQLLVPSAGVDQSP